MPRLVALDLPPGDAFVTALRRAWDRGDAALPVDQRLPSPTRAALLEAMGAGAVIGPEGAETPLPGGRATEEGDALVLATSGTTGEPKGVVHTHASVAAHARAVHRRLVVDPDHDRWLSCLPLAHVGGLGVVTRSLVTGTPLTVLPGFEAEAVTAAARSGSTLVSLVHTALDRIDAGLFRWVVLGGAADPHERPANVVHTYGMTETGGGVVYDDGPLEGVEVRVVAGEIQLRTPTLLRCYRDGSDPRTPDGWYPTDDLGSLDGSGRLHVDGRRGDLIVTGGENVWPAPVEEILRDLPGVADVAVVGVPDPEWGRSVAAVVVPAAGDSVPSLDQIRAAVRERLPAYMAPRQVATVAELPRTALGKVRREDLLRLVQAPAQPRALPF